MKLFVTPWAWAYRPLRIDARLGEQSDVVQKGFRKYTPSRARRSMFGVEIVDLGLMLTESQRWSSVRMNSTFGRRGSSCTSAAPRISAIVNNRAKQNATVRRDMAMLVAEW